MRSTQIDNEVANKDPLGMKIRTATRADDDAIWSIIEPMLRAGETYALPRDLSKEEALDYWFSLSNAVFVVESSAELGVDERLSKPDGERGRVLFNRPDGASTPSGGETQALGTYYLRANQQGGGSHVANCGYVTAKDSSGRGVARAMCEHSLEEARRRGFCSMQFNLVVSTNERAVRLWQSIGFSIVGTSPEAFLHPSFGYVDAFVMWRRL